jgi:hypothetical protein
MTEKEQSVQSSKLVRILQKRLEALYTHFVLQGSIKKLQINCAHIHEVMHKFSRPTQKLFVS